MNQNNDEKILIEAGLSEEQAAIYSALLDKGPLKAGAIASWTGIKRGLIYKVLDQLENMGLVSKKGGEGTVAVFAPEHPSHLSEMMERKEKSLALAKETVSFSLGALSSKFNLLSGKPNVQFYEGIDGATKITSDLPIENKEILSYLDSEKVIKLLPAQNTEHSKLRERLGITKKIIIPNNEFDISRAKNYDKNFTETKVMANSSSFPSAIQIYDNKISFLTLSEQKMIGVIIEDKDIAEMMRNIFNSNWDKLDSTL